MIQNKLIIYELIGLQIRNYVALILNLNLLIL